MRLAYWAKVTTASPVVTAVETPSHSSNKKCYVSRILPNTYLSYSSENNGLCFGGLPFHLKYFCLCRKLPDYWIDDTVMMLSKQKCSCSGTALWGAHPSSQSDLPLGSFLWFFICKQFLLHHCLKTHRGLFCQAKFIRSISISGWYKANHCRSIIFMGRYKLKF